LVGVDLAVCGWIGVVLALVAALAALATVAGLTRNALVPDMVAAPRLLRANAALRGATAIGRMAGWPIGGFLTGMLGSGSVLLLDAASFVVLAAGAMLIHTRRIPGTRRKPGTVSGPCSDGGIRERTGSRVDPILTLVTGSVGLVLLFVSTTNVAQVFFVKDILGASDTGYGVVSACWMVGAVLAVPVLAHGRCTRGALASTVVASEAVTGLAVFGAGLSSSPVIAGAWYVLGGLGSSSMLIAGAALRQLVAPEAERGRVLALYNTLANAAIVVALGISVVLINWMGARGVFLAAGVLAVMAAALTGGVLRILPELALKPARRSDSSVSKRA